MRLTASVSARDTELACLSLEAIIITYLVIAWMELLQIFYLEKLTKKSQVLLSQDCLDSAVNFYAGMLHACFLYIAFVH
jgi:hypothetical protein